MKRALVIFVKYPEAGRVKTRLAKSIGFEKAAQLYKDLVERNLAELRPLHGNVCDCWIAYDPPEKASQMRQWLSKDFLYLAQEGEGLTERLTNAFQQTFSLRYNAVAALGSDTLNLSRDLIRQAFDQLKTSDVVIGPAQDGGYYLIGTNQFLPEIFQGITWSTPSVLTQTSKRVESLKLKPSLMAPLEDLDDIDNLPVQRGF